MVGDVCVYGGCRGDQRCGGVCMRESVSVRVRDVGATSWRWFHVE